MQQFWQRVTRCLSKGSRGHRRPLWGLILPRYYSMNSGGGSRRPRNKESVQDALFWRRVARVSIGYQRPLPLVMVVDPIAS